MEYFFSSFLLQGSQVHIVTEDHLGKTFHPFSQKDSHCRHYHLPLLFNPIFRFDESSKKWRCQICKGNSSIEEVFFRSKKGGKTFDPNSENLHFQMKFSPELLWGDGRPLSSRDFIFTHQVASKIDHDFPSRHFYNSIKKIIVPSKDKVNDAETVEIVFQGGTSPLMHIDQVYLLPSHIEEPFWKQAQERVHEYLNISQYTVNPTREGLFNGPFTIEKYSINGNVQLKKNKFASFGAPKLDKIVLISQNPKTRTKNHNLLIPEKISYPCCDSRYTSLKTLSKTIPNNKLVEGPTRYLESLSFNLRNPQLDLRVRKALALTIPRTRIFKENSEAELFRNSSFFHLTDIDYAFQQDQIIKEEVKAAGELLTNANWKKGQTQLREKNGLNLSVNIQIAADSPSREKLARLIANAWLDLGVKSDVEVVRYNHFFKDVVATMNYRGSVLFSYLVPTYSDLFHIFHSKSIPSKANQYCGQNITGWINFSVDDLCERLFNTIDLHQRHEIMVKIAGYYKQDLPIIPIGFSKQTALIPRRLKGFTLTPNQPSSINARNWAIEESI